MQTIERKTASATPLIISYLRFSQIGQAKGDSTRRQTDGAEAWCRARGVTLDNRLDDKGISAFRGRNRTSGNLSAFLECVRDGKVPVGSTLIVEDLDRLSRQAPEEALELFLSIIRAGITVVTLIDGNEYRRGELDMQKLMVSVMRICLAHEESAKKSMRLAKAWGAKRTALESGKVMTSVLPFWLKVENDKVVIDEAKAAIIRQMFALVIDGFGQTIIAAKLKKGRSYVAKCLHNPQVIGEFQPHQLAYDSDGNKTRKPIGSPIKGYYPAIVGEPTYHAVQRIMKSRRRDTGPSTEFVNLFKGICYSADDATPMVVINKGSGESHRQYVSAAAAQHRENAAPYIAVPIDVIETALMDALCLARNIEPTKTEPITTELAVVDARFAEVASQINKLQAALATAGNVAAVVEVVAKLEAEKKQLDVRRRDLHDQLADANAGEDQNAYLYIRANRHVGDIDGRTKLRSHIRKHVRRIEISVTRSAHVRTAHWTIIFAEGVKMSGTTTFNTRDPEAVAKTEQAKELWGKAVRPVLISKQTGMSVSQIYRCCKGIKRVGAWKPASRWDSKK